MTVDRNPPSPAYGFGEIDWFGNKQTGGQYGFIKEADGTDHFFVGHRCSGFSPATGTLVVFELIPSTRHRGKYEAINVCQLSSVDNASLLLHFAFQRDQYKPNAKYFHALARRYAEVAEARQWNGPDIINHLAEAGLLPKDNAPPTFLEAIRQPLAFLAAGLPNTKQDECIGLLLSCLTDVDIANGFFSKHLPYGRHILDALLRQWPFLSETQRLIAISSARSDPNHFLGQYARIAIPVIAAERSGTVVAHIIELLRHLDWRKSGDSSSGLPESIMTILINAPIEQRLIAYREGYLPLDRPMTRWLIRSWREMTGDAKKKLIDDSLAIGLPLLDDISGQLLIPLAATRPYDAFYLLQELIQHFPDNADQLFIRMHEEQDVGIISALLWIHELRERDDPLAYATVVSGLTTSDQRLYLKKLIAWMLTHDVTVSVETLRNVVWTDISTWVVLEIIDAMQNHRQITSQGVIGYIISHIESPDSDINIDGYFDDCPGRGYLTKDGELERTNVPRFTKWCEGRLLPPKKVKEGEEIDTRPRWWCANQTCMAPAICDRNPAEYRNYTLWNILKAFRVNYPRAEYEKMMGTLNRIRQLTERVRCRDCNHIMHPLKRKNDGQSNYAFYRVNRFCCANPACQNRDEVYLSHCINGTCTNIVDSRDSARCKPSGYSQQTCGWYICSYCHSCCTTEGLERRKSVMDMTDQEYTCHLEGHRDRHEICCPKCGTVMRSIARTDVRDWLLRQANRTTYIARQGVRKDGGKWFLIKKSGFKDDAQFQSFAKHAIECGYSIPDRDEGNKDVYLLAEPRCGTFSPLLQCPDCKYDLNINQIVADRDYQHLAALRIHDYVSKLYPKQQVQ